MSTVPEEAGYPKGFSNTVRRIRERILRVSIDELVEAEPSLDEEAVRAVESNGVVVKNQWVYYYDSAIRVLRPHVGPNLIASVAVANYEDPEKEQEISQVLSDRPRGLAAVQVGLSVQDRHEVNATSCTLLPEYGPLSGTEVEFAANIFTTLAKRYAGWVFVGWRHTQPGNPLFGIANRWHKLIHDWRYETDADIFHIGVPAGLHQPSSPFLLVDPIQGITHFDEAWQRAIDLGASPAEGMLVAWAILAANRQPVGQQRRSALANWAAIDRGGVQAISSALSTENDSSDPANVPDFEQILVAGRRFLGAWLNTFELSRREPQIDYATGDLKVSQRYAPDSVSKATRQDPDSEPARTTLWSTLVIYDDETLRALPVALAKNQPAMDLRPDGFAFAFPSPGPEFLEWIPSGASNRILVRGTDGGWTPVQVAT